MIDTLTQAAAQDSQGGDIWQWAALPMGILGSLIAAIIIAISAKLRALCGLALFKVYVHVRRLLHFLLVRRDPATWKPLKPFVAPQPKRRPNAEQAPSNEMHMASPAGRSQAGMRDSSIPRRVPLSAADLKGQTSAPPMFKLEYERKGDRLLRERDYVLRLLNHGKGDALDVRLDPVNTKATAPTHWQLIPSGHHTTFQLEPHEHQYRFKTWFKVSYVEASTGLRVPPQDLVLPPEDAG